MALVNQGTFIDKGNLKKKINVFLGKKKYFC